MQAQIVNVNVTIVIAAVQSLVITMLRETRISSQAEAVYGCVVRLY